MIELTVGLHVRDGRRTTLLTTPVCHKGPFLLDEVGVAFGSIRPRIRMIRLLPVTTCLAGFRVLRAVRRTKVLLGLDVVALRASLLTRRQDFGRDGVATAFGVRVLFIQTCPTHFLATSVRLGIKGGHRKRFLALGTRV